MSKSYHKTTIQVAALVSRYGFELKGVTLLELIEDWSASYSFYWIRLAVIEALYQGRYKVISVEQILRMWKRRGQPTFHFTRDFERLVDHQLSYNAPKTEEETLTYSQPKKPKKTPSQPNIPPIQAINPQQTREIKIYPSSQEMITPIIINPLDLEEKVKENHDPLKTELSLTNINNSSPHFITQRSIHQFVPNSDSTQLYSKLMAVARQELAENFESSTFS
jgi:hypothetical protein